MHKGSHEASTQEYKHNVGFAVSTPKTQEVPMLSLRQLIVSAALATAFGFGLSAIATDNDDDKRTRQRAEDRTDRAEDRADHKAIDGSKAPTDDNFAGKPSRSNRVTLTVDATSFF